MRQKGFLATSNPTFPSWTVKVNDKESRLLNVYGAFLGVELEQGVNRVEFQFNDYWGILSKIVSIITFLTGILLILFLKKVKPKKIILKVK